MAATVVLTVLSGELKGKKFVFTNPVVCTIGRGEDCAIRFPSTIQYMSVSRHHCTLVIDPPILQAQDLGSRNGTYVNGKIIGHRHAASSNQPRISDQVDLKDCDELRVGDVLLQVLILEPDQPNPAQDGAQKANPDIFESLHT